MVGIYKRPYLVPSLLCVKWLISGEYSFPVADDPMLAWDSHMIHFDLKLINILNMITPGLVM